MRLIVHSRTRLFADCLSEGLQHHAEVDLAVGSPDAGRTLALIEEIHPTAVIVDLSHQEAWGDAERLQPLCGSVPLLGLAVEDRPEDVVRCARIGCAGIIAHDNSIERTVQTIRAAQRGELACSARSAGGLMRALAPATHYRDSLPLCLTRRESEICGLVCEGLTNKQIARELACSEGTVKNHVHHILNKLNVERRSALPQRVLAQRILSQRAEL